MRNLNITDKKFWLHFLHGSLCGLLMHQNMLAGNLKGMAAATVLLLIPPLLSGGKEKTAENTGT